jgi:hypothetical protein
MVTITLISKLYTSNRNVKSLLGRLAWFIYILVKNILEIITRPKTNTCGSSFLTDPIFSADPIIFFNAIDHATLFSPGGCGLLIQHAKMASVVTIIIEPKYQIA